MSSRLEVAVIGGGTGTYTALVGLKEYPVNLTAIVSMADDGGSSGRLRDEFGHLPPGDVRRCLLALSSNESAKTLRTLFEYRFDRGSGLNGHSLGNLFLTALTELTGGTEEAIAEAARLLSVRGSVLPVALANTCLCAELEDGTLIQGESKLDIRTVSPEVRIARVFLTPNVPANPAVLEAIGKADVLVIGPGDLYTSVIPNLLVRGVREAIVACSACKVYVCNLMTKHGETDGFRASDFVAEVTRYLGGAAIDCAIVSNPASYPPALLQKYATEHAYPVEPDLAQCSELGVNPWLASLAASGTLLRHDSQLLASMIMQLAKVRMRREPAHSISLEPALAVSRIDGSDRPF